MNMGLDDDYLESMKGSESAKDFRSSREKHVPHYYGDEVRIFFVIVGALLLASMLFDKDLLVFNILVGVVGVLILTIVAGLTSPRSFTVLVIDAVIAGLVFVFFEFFAISAYYRHETVLDVVFALRQSIAFVALAALYFSVKSIRGLRRVRAEEL